MKSTATFAGVALSALLILPAFARDLGEANEIQDLTGSDLAREFAEAAAERLGEPVQNTLPNYQFIDHGTFWEINAVNAGNFQSSNIDNTLYNEIFDALNEWYGSMGDDPDFVVLYKAWDPPSYGAFYAPMSNDTQGIGYKHQGPEVFDQTPGLKLSGLIWMSALNQYNFGTNSRIVLNAFWGQEFGHRWGSFVRFDDDGFQSGELLGRDDAHWSYWLDTDWSCMEGNDWTDNGNGTFTINLNSFSGAPSYNPLDLYLMGLIPASAVPEIALISGPSGTTRNPSSPPEMPFGGSQVTASGTLKHVTMDQILAVEGPRNPEWLLERRTYKVAMFVLSRNGAQMSSTQIGQAEDYAQWMVDDFNYNTRYTATFDITTGTPTLNSKPKPSLSMDGDPKEDRPFTLDASGSTDPEGSELTFIWDFGDGTGDFTTGPVVEKTWEKDGEFLVSLVVVDRDGQSDWLQETVEVQAKADDGPIGCLCAMTPQQKSKVPAAGILLALMGAALIVRRRYA